ncbi:hypothetical protein V9T40_011395 [Parthenolecanium corni]|uniref:Large ribosomal subunit protein mL46 n=1 Tax=Parthenolecanium corni TaxID=536013 RepID=A0AAN9T6T7_9HEMI
MQFCRPALSQAVKRQILSVKNISSSTQLVEKWDIVCGVCLERKPVITRPLNDLEIRFSKMLQQIELENSQKSEHELRCEADAKRAQEFKKGKISTEDLDKAVGQSATEFEDVSMKELKAFQVAPRITEADEKNDIKSMDRKLDKHLLFIIAENLGKNNLWVLPHDLVKGEESLREAAERILSEKCGSKVRARFYGNAPCGFYKYKYPKSMRQNALGAKIFFMKAQYLKGSIEEAKVKDYSWASRDELANCFHASYHKAVRPFLIDDESAELNEK